MAARATTTVPSTGTDESVAKIHAPLHLSAALYAYVLRVGIRENQHLQKLRLLSESHPRARMTSPPEGAALLQMLVKLAGVKRGIEVGVFTGYSALAVALALPADGKLVALDIQDGDVNAYGRPVWRESGMEDKIDFRVGPAAQSLDAMIANGEYHQYDYAFVDADKSNYRQYYERLLRLVRPGGLIVFDNTLWSGKVLDDSRTDDDTIAIRGLNAALHADTRVDIVLLPVADGMTIVRICSNTM